MYVGSYGIINYPHSNNHAYFPSPIGTVDTKGLNSAELDPLEDLKAKPQQLAYSTQRRWQRRI